MGVEQTRGLALVPPWIPRRTTSFRWTTATWWTTPRRASATSASPTACCRASCCTRCAARFLEEMLAICRPPPHPRTGSHAREPRRSPLASHNLAARAALRSTAPTRPTARTASLTRSSRRARAPSRSSRTAWTPPSSSAPRSTTQTWTTWPAPRCAHPAHQAGPSHADPPALVCCARLAQRAASTQTPRGRRRKPAAVCVAAASATAEQQATWRERRTSSSRARACVAGASVLQLLAAGQPHVQRDEQPQRDDQPVALLRRAVQRPAAALRLPPLPHGGQGARPLPIDRLRSPCWCMLVPARAPRDRAGPRYPACQMLQKPTWSDACSLPTRLLSRTGEQRECMALSFPLRRAASWLPGAAGHQSGRRGRADVGDVPGGGALPGPAHARAHRRAHDLQRAAAHLWLFQHRVLLLGRRLHQGARVCARACAFARA